MRPWLLLLAACGGSTSPVVATAPAPEAVSCSDASKVLRGNVTSDDAAAGPARESAILRACEGDHWSRAVLECIGRERVAATCIAKLDDAQRDSYQAKLDTWDAQYAQDAGDAVPDPDSVAAAEPFYYCDDLVDQPQGFSPKLDLKSAEYDWQVRTRKRLALNACEGEWKQSTKKCVDETRDLETCDTPLSQVLTEVDAAATKIAVARTKPKSITCEKATAVHYGDPKWQDRLKGAPDRAQQIARSRKQMREACTAEHWSEQQRACIVVADRPYCFDEWTAIQYGYPVYVAPPAVAMLPAPCQTWAAVTERLKTCDSIAPEARAALVEIYEQVIKTPTPSLAQACVVGASHGLEAFKACGTW